MNPDTVVIGGFVLAAALLVLAWILDSRSDRRRPLCARDGCRAVGILTDQHRVWCVFHAPGTEDF